MYFFEQTSDTNTEFDDTGNFSLRVKKKTQKTKPKPNHNQNPSIFLL